MARPTMIDPRGDEIRSSLVHRKTNSDNSAAVAVQSMKERKVL